jgi:hypothetical protein
MAKINLLGVAVVARDMIDKGWMKGSWHKKGWRDGEAVDFVCTEGAIQQSLRLAIAQTINEEPTLCTQLNALDAAKRKQVVETMATNLSRGRDRAVFGYLEKMLGVVSIPGWNDSRERTKEEVLRLFDQLISDIEQLSPEAQDFELALQERE